MLLEIGLNQPSGGSLHRVAQLLQHLAHMSRVILLFELLCDDLAHPRTGTNPSFQTVSGRPAIENIAKLLSLLRAQTAGPPTPMSLR